MEQQTMLFNMINTSKCSHASSSVESAIVSTKMIQAQTQQKFILRILCQPDVMGHPAGPDGRAGPGEILSINEWDPVPISHDVSEVLVANTILVEEAEGTTTTAPEAPQTDETRLDAGAQSPAVATTWWQRPLGDQGAQPQELRCVNLGFSNSNCWEFWTLCLHRRRLFLRGPWTNSSQPGPCKRESPKPRLGS